MSIFMTPPDDGTRNTIALPGKTYSSTPGVQIPIANDGHAATLAANGWRLVSGFTIDDKTTFNTVAGGTPLALTPAQVSGALHVAVSLTATLGAGGTVTLPGTAAWIAALPIATTGASYILRIGNASSANFAWTVAAGDSGTTLAGATQTIAQNAFREYFVLITSPTTLTVQSIGGGTWP